MRSPRSSFYLRGGRRQQTDASGEKPRNGDYVCRGLSTRLEVTRKMNANHEARRRRTGAAAAASGEQNRTGGGRGNSHCVGDPSLYGRPSCVGDPHCVRLLCGRPLTVWETLKV